MGDPLITFPIKNQSDPMTLSTVEDLDAWINQEQAFWNWILPISNSDGSLHPLWADMHNWFSKIRSQIKIYQSTENKDDRNKAVIALNHCLSQVYNTPLTLPSSSPGAQFVASLKTVSPHIAAYTLFGLINKNPLQQISNSYAIKGITLATLFEHGLSSETAEAHQSTLSNAQEKWSTFHQSASHEYKTDKQVTDALKADVEAWRIQQQNLNDDLSTAAKARFNTIEGTIIDKFTTIENIYNEKLGLAAPVTYWEARAKSYLHQAIGYLIAAMIVGGLTGIAVWAEIQALVIPFADAMGADGHQLAHAWRYAFVIASAAFFVWPVRILVRMLLSSLHLRIDAIERTTLAKTYLSLLNRKEALGDNDRKLILEILFRPTSTGVVSDDAAPTSFFQILSRFASGNRKRRTGARPGFKLLPPP